MGGSSSTTQQQSQTAPWQAAQPLLGGILGQLQGQLGNTGITNTQTNALNAIEGNAGNTSQFTPQINGVTSNLLGGGNANAQAGTIQNAFNTYQAQTNPLASNTNYDPMQTPGIGQQLQTLQDQITQSVNGQFAAAGRDGSGYNQQDVARGLAQGLAPVATYQYNQNVQNQQGAANNLYNAGNTTANALTNLNQTGLTNQLAGVQNVSNGLSATNAGNSATLAAEAMRQGIPLQNLGLLSQIGTPIAGLGSQSSGSSTTNNQASLASIIGSLGSSLGSFSSNPNGTSSGSGLMGLLSFL